MLYFCSKLTAFRLREKPDIVFTTPKGKAKTQTLQKVVEQLLGDLENEDSRGLKKHLLAYRNHTIKQPSLTPSDLNTVCRYWTGLYKWMVENLFISEEIVWKEG